MATTVLECQDYATVLLDTEGIDAVGASETVAMSLLTLTTLLSSFLIYNSKNVPKDIDLHKMRSFSQLSSSFFTQCPQCLAMKDMFPKFLWLLRDMSLKMTDREGKELEPTEFLHTRILASESGELTDLGKSLVSLFPSLESATLPLPSIRPSIVHDIFNNQDQLNPKFNSKVDSLVQQILQKVTPKKAFNGVTTVNGKALAALAVGYVEAVNRPGALPDLDQGWQAVVRLELKEVSYRLVREYEREMEEALEKEKLPVKQEWLMGIHRQILSGKKSILKEKICSINPLHSSDKEIELLLDQLEQGIVQWSKQCENEETRQVVGGSLLQFTTLNFSKSKEHCQTLFMQLMAESNIQQKVTEALRNSKPLDITAEVDTIVAEYE